MTDTFVQFAYILFLLFYFETSFAHKDADNSYKLAFEMPFPLSRRAATLPVWKYSLL